MSLQGKTVLVTGATDGLGRLVAEMAAKDGATVLLHGRDRAKGERALSEIRAASGNDRVELYIADLASLDDVRRLAREVTATHDRLHVLLNNAGVGLFANQPRQESKDGLELHFQVNYLAPFLLTRLLLPTLRASAPARIVNVSSLGQAPIDFADAQLVKSYSGYQGYCQSKLAQVMLPIDLAERLKGTGVTVTSLHPGTFMNTNMVVGQGMTPRSKVEDGAAATFRLIASPEVEGETGTFRNQFEPGQPDAQAADAGARRKLWTLSCELSGLAAD